MPTVAAPATSGTPEQGSGLAVSELSDRELRVQFDVELGFILITDLSRGRCPSICCTGYPNGVPDNPGWHLGFSRKRRTKSRPRRYVRHLRNDGVIFHFLLPVSLSRGFPTTKTGKHQPSIRVRLRLDSDAALWRHESCDIVSCFTRIGWRSGTK